MKVKELTERIERFNSELIEHAHLWKGSHDPYLPDYPIKNVTTLREQMARLGRQLGGLRPYIDAFGLPSVMQMAGVEWDVYDSAVSNDLALRKGHSIEGVLSQLQQILGRLDLMNPDDEFPGNERVASAGSGAQPVAIYNLLGSQSRVNIHSNDHSSNWEQTAPPTRAKGGKKRFALGAEVWVIVPGIDGVVTKLDNTPSAMGAYWHTVRTQHGERREPGCNLELKPKPQS